MNLSKFVFVATSSFTTPRTSEPCGRNSLNSNHHAPDRQNTDGSLIPHLAGPYFSKPQNYQTRIQKMPDKSKNTPGSPIAA
jgi:hypothetical protein